MLTVRGNRLELNPEVLNPRSISQTQGYHPSFYDLQAQFRHSVLVIRRGGWQMPVCGYVCLHTSQGVTVSLVQLPKNKATIIA